MALFLNMGGKPTDPWIPWEVAQVIRGKMKLQNVIHWIKAISIDHDSIGGRTPLREVSSVGHYKRSTATGSSTIVTSMYSTLQNRKRTARSIGCRCAIPRQVKYRPMAIGHSRLALQREHVVHTLRDHTESTERAASPGYVSCAAARDVHQTPRARPLQAGDGPFPWPGQHCSCLFKPR